MGEWIDVVVVGGGQAGLAVSHELKALGVEHVVLERGRIAQTWRDRWDSFCLVTPNWSVQLPGGAYAGEDPEGFMARDQIVAHLQAYAVSFSAPVREGVEVTRLEGAPEGGFRLTTADGVLRASRVVLATGAYQHPHRPSGVHRCRAACFRSAPRVTPTRPLCLLARCWSWAPASAAVSSPRSCGRPAGR